MALSTKYTITISDKQLTFESAYYEIINVSGNKKDMHLTVVIFNSSEKNDELGTQQFIFHPSEAEGSSNIFKQGYEYLKTLPEFATAIDC